MRSTLMPSFSVAMVSADALAAANRRRGALGEEEEKLRRPVRSWTEGVATIGLAISLKKEVTALRGPSRVAVVCVWKAPAFMVS